MKRLRLRKIWVVFAVFLLMVPLLSGKLEKTEATAPGTTETTTSDTPMSSYQIKFILENATSLVPDDGVSMHEFELRPTGNTETEFRWANSSRMKVQLWVNGAEATDVLNNYDDVLWEIKVNGELVSGTAVSAGGMTVTPLDLESTKTTKVYDITPQGAGILRFDINVTLMKDGKPGAYAFRQALITSPLQIFYQKTSTNYYKYLCTTTNTSDIAILANNTTSQTMYWYYYDFTTDEYVKLEDPEAVDTTLAKESTGKLGLVSGLQNAGTVYDVGAGENFKVYKYTLSTGSNAGISRIVGRLYLNNDTTSKEYIEQSIDVLIEAEVKSKVSSNGDNVVNIEYGQTISFDSISNDKGNSLEWYPAGEEKTRVQPKVVELTSGVGATGKYYGIEKVELTPVPTFYNWEWFDAVNNVMKKYVNFKTAFTVLKGNVEEYRQKAESYEVVDVNGSITLSTNVKTESGIDYQWYWIDGNGRENSVLTNEDNEYIDVTSGVIAAQGTYSAIQVTGVKAGTVVLRCRVSGANVDPTECVQDITIKVVDSLVLSENRRSVVKGETFELSAMTTDVTGEVTWVSEDEEYVTVDPTGRTVTVTGVEVTGDKWVTITATHVASGRTAVCRVRVVEPISAVTIEGEKVIAKGSKSELWLEFAGNPPSYPEDSLRWIIRDKDGVEAETIINLTQNDVEQTKAIVEGLEVGEAYVAVILSEVRGNSTVETELAVATIRVVTEPEGLTIDEGPSVVDYLENETYTLHATILPDGYVATDQVTVRWYSNDENIATVKPSEEDSKIAVVTYQAVGKVRITAVVAGMPEATDFVDFDIQNPVQEIDLNLDDDKLYMKEGETRQLEATVKPDNASDKTLTWVSENPDVASVSENGLVTANKAGVTIITVTASNGVQKQCVVTVLVAAERIELNYYNITVKKNTIFYLSAQVLPTDTYDKTVTYVSSDEDIVTVDPDGTVTAVGVGVAEITVTSNDNPEIEPAVCIVTVVEAVSGITLNAREVTIDVGEQYLLKATVHPSDATNNKVTFKSADESIATVSENGLITGIKGGTTVVFVTTEERGLTASCTVIVQEDITSITLSETETYVGKGKDKKITATILPTSATKKKLLWKSSDESIVIVDQEGNIHGVNLGTATITATAQDDGKVSATCKVTVVDEVTKIVLGENIIRMVQDDKHQLTYTIEPNYASVKMVNWSTSDASVARVDSLGLVTAVGGGEAKIRVTAADGSGVYAECTVIVEALVPATSITVNTTDTTMVVGDTRTLAARLLPRNTSETVRWVSSDTSVATVNSDGSVTAVGPGVCKMTAISNKTGLESTTTITVLGLNETSLTLEQYDTFDLYLDGVSSGVTWFSKNKRVATVSRKGVITGRREGTTEIVARVNGKMVSCMVSVEKLKK